jgi:hypothetical protein
MSCNCNSSTYSSTCCPEVPYPSISSESVPSLIDNLVYALYGTINKSIVNGRVAWDVPCDPNATPASVPQIPREENEGLLCYLIRIFTEICGQLYVGIPSSNLKWQFNGDGLTSEFEISGASNLNPECYIVSIDGVVQNPTIDYTISTTPTYKLNTTSSVPSGSIIVIVQLNTTVSGWYIGSGSPNGITTANPGSIYTSTVGGANATLWVKESGTGNTGWVSK